MKLALTTSALLVVAIAVVPPPNVCQAADGHDCTMGEDEDDGNMALQVHKDAAKEFDQDAIGSIADEYTVRYKVDTAIAFGSQAFMDEMEKQEIAAQTGVSLDTFFENMGAPTVTITDAEGNAVQAGGDPPDSGYPMQLTLVFKKASSPDLAMVQTGETERVFAHNNWLRTRWDLADKVYEENSMTIKASWNATSNKYTDGVHITNCKFAFKGSDHPLQGGLADDWINNLVGYFTDYVNVNGYQVHSGFHAEFETVRKAGLDAYVAKCSNPEFIGHSLGGAMANIARVHYNKGTVTTFCAPRTFKKGTGCPIAGNGRVFSEFDPVAGGGFGLTDAFEHGQSGLRVYYKCVQRSWWGWWCDKWARDAKAASCTEDSYWWSLDIMKYHMFGYWWGLFSNPVHRSHHGH